MKRAPHYFDRDLRATVVKVLPGEYLATTRDVCLVTVLGSCISVCLNDPFARAGGMNHFMLPEGSLGGVASMPARYGAYAMEVLLNDLLKIGARRERLQARVFGGGHVLKGFGDPIGTRNYRFTRDYLERERLPIVAEDVLGPSPRKVGFHAPTGRTWLKHLPSAPDPDRVHLQHPVPVPNPIEIFQP